MDEYRVGGTPHWVHKNGVRLFVWEKRAQLGTVPAGTIFFVHGSSMSCQATFDLSVPGRSFSSAMNWFSARGFHTWTMDHEGYGRSDKHRPINFDVSNGADDIEAATRYVLTRSGHDALFLYGVSSGALRAALFAQRHPARVRKLALDALVWTGKGSPTLRERKKRLPELLAAKRRPIDRAFLQGIFDRDRPGTADLPTIHAVADAVLSLDDSMPTGSYVDMCSRLPLIDPRQIEAPTLVMRGEHDGIATMEDVLSFFQQLPNMDKQFSVMAGIAHASFQQKNYMSAYQTLRDFFARCPPAYSG